jgi:spore cortex formation protein SpoVR/YcgB (stage V sporulation)
MSNDHFEYARDLELLMMWDKRMIAAGKRLGLSPYPIDYRLTTDEGVTQTLPYVGMPNDYVHWSKGKEAEANRRQGYGGHIYEMVLNTNPSICYLSTTNTLPMQLHVMAHAVWGHVDFFANNKTFAETMPESIIARLTQYRNKINALVDSPDWGWEGVEYFLDACHAISNHVGWGATNKEKLTDKELREQLRQEVSDLRRRIINEGEISVSKKVQLERQVAVIESALRRYPIQPAYDLLHFLMQEENTPNLPDEARMMMSIVHDRSRYFQPQGRTKFMNEGWASYWQRELLLQPEVDLPLEYRFDLAQSWHMHYQVAVNSYFDPYALGQNIWRYIDEKYGSDEGIDKVKVKRIVKNADGEYVEGKKTQTMEVVRRNRDKMMEVRRHYDDNRFVNEFMGEELFEKINLENLEWVRRIIKIINKTLKKNGWNRKFVFENPEPMTLEDLFQVVQVWSQVQETSESYHEELGQPLFPVPAQTLQHMGTVIQIVAAFDQNKHKARRMIAMRTAYHSLPNITIQDTGKLGDGSWTLKHEFDETFGPLLQSECRDTLKFFRRLCGAPVRLLTMEQRTDARGNPIGKPAPFEYFTEDGEVVKERWL